MRKRNKLQLTCAFPIAKPNEKGRVLCFLLNVEEQRKRRNRYSVKVYLKVLDEEGNAVRETIQCNYNASRSEDFGALWRSKLIREYFKEFCIRRIIDGKIALDKWHLGYAKRRHLFFVIVINESKSGGYHLRAHFEIQDAKKQVIKKIPCNYNGTSVMHSVFCSDAWKRYQEMKKLLCEFMRSASPKE